MSYRFDIFVCLGLFLCWSDPVSAGSPPIAVEQIALLLNYPAERISVNDSTELRNRVALRKSRNTVLSSHVYTSSDNTFAPLTITIGKKGTILTADLRDYADKGLALEGTTISKFSLPNAGSGYFGLGMVGPGGSDEQLTMTLPDHDRDIQITITLLGETPLEPLAGYENYLEIANSRTKIRETAIACAKIIGGSFVQIPSDGSVQGSSPKATENKPKIQQVELMLPSEDNHAHIQLAQRRVWLWVVGALALIIAFLAALKRRS